MAFRLRALMVAGAMAGVVWMTASRSKADEAPPPASAAHPDSAASGGAGTAATALSPASKGKPASEAKAPAAKPQSKVEISPELAALRDRVRRTLVLYFHQLVNTADNTPADVLQFCLAFGCDTEIRYGSAAGTPMNGIGCLCWDYPCEGYQLLVGDQHRIMARVGYGFQEEPSQLLAMLAQSGVPADYEMRCGTRKGTVNDLVESEKLDCRAGSDLSLKLVGMSFYVENGREWKNRMGDTWSVERIVREELDRSPAENNVDVTNRLLGLSHAVQRQLRVKKPVEGQYLRASQYVSECEDFAFRLQNTDGSWHPTFFAARGTSNDAVGSLRSTGHILEWLAYALPEERLGDRRVVKSVDYLAGSLEALASRWNVSTATPQEMGAVMHAAHALRTYDRRAFKAQERNGAEATRTEPVDAPKSP